MNTNELLGLQAKTAVVWGGGAGMGADTARRLAAAGCKLAVVDLELARAQQVVAELSQAGAIAIALQADATNEREVEAAVKTVEAELGVIEVMVTVIGIGVWSSVLDMSEQQLDDAIRLNLKSFFFPARAVARSMIANKKPGSIVCVASVSGMTSAPNHAGYGAAKAGMVNMVRTMAVEWGPHNIRVNAIAPGAIVTPRLQPDEKALAFMGTIFPLGRPGTTDEIAKAALFLSSDLASYMTGHTMPVDGGWLSTFLTHAAGNSNQLSRGGDADA